MEKLLDLSTKLSLDAWKQQVARFDKLISELPDEQIQKEVAPGRNTGVYLLGHLAAVHDALLPLLGIGEKLQPGMEEIFIKSPDKSQHKKPSVDELKTYWHQVNKKLSEEFENYDDEQWLEKHTSVSEEDFKKEPQRNKLNVLISRTNHLAYHFGQMALLKK
jgi:uncharacterized damage-inducible protein DinB